ncbi:mutS protein homolog 5-like [Dysidea avara]|uniref:mutS protein homolog 5-like n=1 Tax=Dysidea avara TaxID=196820 RepID=UPI0033314459
MDSPSPSLEGSLNEEDVSIHRKVLIDGDNEEERQVTACVLWQGHKLGFSCYDADTSYLHYMPDVAETEDFGYLSRVLLQTGPTTILTSCKQDDHLQKVLHSYAQPSPDEDLPSKASVEILPSSDFMLEAAKRRILSLANFPGVPAHYTDEERQIYITSVIAFENPCMVRTLGALLKYMDKKRIGVELEGVNVRVPILAVKSFSLDNLMVVDDNSYSALQIFQKELHPSVYKIGKGGTKEGLSLFGIAYKTKSPVGSKLLRFWFLRPLKDITTLQQRLDTIEFLLQPKHADQLSSFQEYLKHIRHIPRILVRMNAAQASIGDWLALYKTTYNAIHIGEMCRTLPKEIAIFNKIAKSFSDELYRVASLISKIVDFDESRIQQRFVVQPNINPELDEKKRIYHGLPDLMTRVAREELDQLGDDIDECNIMYLPQLGYLLAIPCSQGSERMEVDELEFVFFSHGMAYYRSERTKELDTMLGDTQLEIVDEETAIMHRLQSTILEYSEALLSVMDCCAELDCLIALSSLAKENNYCKPQLTGDIMIHIKQGRHPLQELCVSPFVPNDTYCDLENGRMKILTGPNASGKSVYLKQIGLIVFLGHIGSYVPAEAATIGMVDQIFTRIHTRETVSVALSTFMIDLNQISLALRESTERSLVILDEFGKGTATVDGLSLLVASLRHWVSKGTQCPAVLVSTHFHSVTQQKLLPTTSLLQYQMMEVLRDGCELVFLYQLVNGHSNSSFACHIASMAGLPQEIVDRGSEVSDLVRQREPVGRKDVSNFEEQQQKCEIIVSQFLNMDLDNDDVGAFLKDFVLPTTNELV